MKKILVFMSVVCLLVMSLAFTASAANKTYYDLNFDDLDFSINSSSTTEEKTDFATDTGWTISTITNAAKVSTVTATSEDASWTGRGKVLKIDGTPETGETNGALKITVPFSGYTTTNDKLYIEFDLFVDSAYTRNTRMSIFSASAYHNILWFHTNGRMYNNTMLRPSGSYYGPLGAGLSSGVWVRMCYTIDNSDVAESNNPSVNWVTTNIGTPTNKETFKKQIAANVFAGNLYIGGDGYGTNGFALSSGVYYLDNVKIYTKDKFAFDSATFEDAINVSKDTAYIDFAMNDYVLYTSTLGVTLSSNEGTVGVTPEVIDDGKTVRLTLNENESLDYGTKYTVNFENVKSTDGDVIANNKKTFSFTTEQEPELYAPSYRIVKGTGNSAVIYSDFVADAGLYTLETTVKNTTESAKDVTLVYGLYDSSDKLVDTVYVSKSVAAESSEVIGTGLTVPASLSGGKVRVFLWNSTTALQPYFEPMEFNIEDSANETPIIDAAVTDPELELSTLALKKGFFGDVDITKLSEAAGSTINVSTNVTGASKGTVMFGVYKNDVLVNLAYVNKTFSDTDTVSVNIKMPSASDTDTIKLKAFVCKSLADLTPFGTTIELSTNE